MKTWQPQRLAAAVERVRKRHPERLADFEDPASLGQTDIGRRIKRKVMEWGNPPMFGPLLESMNRIEREILPTYLGDRDRKLSVRIAQCVASKPTIAKAELLFPFILRNEDPELLTFLLNALAAVPEHYGLSQRTTTFIRDWRFDDVDGAIRNAWRQTQQTNPRRVAEELNIEPDSNLGRSIQEGFLSHAPVKTWIGAGAAAFLEAFGAAERDLKIQTLVRLWTGWRVDSIDSLMRQPFAKGIGEHLIEHPRIVDLLGREHREAFEFFRNWLKKLELDTFFAAFPDNDRFAFWEAYLPRLEGVTGDRDYGRLFLDFGNFGVVEFAETGNAAYVYSPEHFEYYLELNFRRRNNDHTKLKNQNRALFTLNHSGNWQTNFRTKLRDYL